MPTTIGPSALLILASLAFAQLASAQKTHTLNYAPDKSITLSLPDHFDIQIAATGIKRARFFAKAPDGRIFVTSMYNLADNTRGAIYILDGWDEHTHTFTHVTTYLDHLRNPNNLAFWTDPATHQSWLYLPLTDKLIRYRYNPGDNAPSGSPETLIRFPDYGLGYKYGGWHLTRTVAVTQLNGHPRIFISVGSSCNYCQEHEVLRAAVMSMDPDGKNQRIEAQGLRNAVFIRPIPAISANSIFATNMGDDHLGAKLPEDTFFELKTSQSSAPNYGWPACYFAAGKAVLDRTPLPTLTKLEATTQSKLASSDSVYGKQTGVAAAGTNLTAGGGHPSTSDANANLGQPPAALKSCTQVPPTYTTFAAHSSPLGFEYFTQADPLLNGSFLVALHGAGNPRIGSGYRIVRFTPGDHTPRDFLTGFLTFENGKPVVHGRPCGIFRIAADTFLVSDDYLGLIYYIHPR
jgi:glucose/arabinose dehydrogenase